MRGEFLRHCPHANLTAGLPLRSRCDLWPLHPHTTVPHSRLERPGQFTRICSETTSVRARPRVAVHTSGVSPESPVSRQEIDEAEAHHKEQTPRRLLVSTVINRVRTDAARQGSPDTDETGVSDHAEEVSSPKSFTPPPRDSLLWAPDHRSPRLSREAQQAVLSQVGVPCRSMRWRVIAQCKLAPSPGTDPA